MLGVSLEDLGPGHLDEEADGLVEGATDGGSHQVPLVLMAVGTTWRVKLGIERLDAVAARGSASGAPDAQRSDQAHDPAGVEALVGEARVVCHGGR